MKHSMKIAALLAVMLSVAACGKHLDGKYKDQLGIQSYEFKSDGVVYISTMGITQEAKYKLEDQKIKITQADGTSLIYDLKPDGSISGPLGMELKKQQPAQ